MIKSRFLIFSIVIASFLYGAEEELDANRIYNCNKIFESRKQELILELDKIDEQQQQLEALQAATQSMLDRKEQAIKKKEKILEEQMKKAQEKISELDKKLKKVQEQEDALNKKINDRLITSFSKMNPKKASPILAAMPIVESTEIMFKLTPKIAGKILEKMAPDKAATIAQLLKMGPPFRDFNKDETGLIPKDIDNEIDKEIESSI
jgi:flagellar motility protein MotE (MotC chaperone)